MARRSYVAPAASIEPVETEEVIEEIILDNKESLRRKVKEGKAPSDLFEDIFGEPA
jgi:hypothetical protein